MVNVLHLFFPCCQEKSPTEVESKKEHCRSSAALHMVSSLALGIILGAGAALAAYFLTQGVIMWTAVAGVAATLVISGICYPILRCALRKVNEPHSESTHSKTPESPHIAKPVGGQAKAEKKKPELPKLDEYWSKRLIQQVHPYPGDLPKEEKATLKTEQLDCVFKIQGESVSFEVRKQNMRDSHATVLVNAANRHLQGGSGIDGDLNEWGGKEYRQEQGVRLKSQYREGYVAGHAALIGSGELSKIGVDNVIVVMGPMYAEHPEANSQLYSCYYNSLVLAHQHQKTSIAFPGIGTGVFGFPKEKAAEISIRAIRDFQTQHPDTTLKTISIHYLQDSEHVLEKYQNALKLA